MVTAASTGAGPTPTGGDAWILYDGACGLCHGAVRFVVARDAAGRFRYAPLHGETCGRILSEGIRGTLPDSLVLVLEDGNILVRWAAVVAILRRLPDPWNRVGRAGAHLPRFLGDAGYRVVAALRRHLFPIPVDSCPVVPAALRSRFAS